MTSIIELMKYVDKEGCSDLHLSAGEPPIVRKSGDLRRLDQPALSHEDVTKMIKSLTTEIQWQQLEKNLELDFSYALADVARFRINAFYQMNGLSAAFRTLSFSIPTLDSIHLLNPVFKTVCTYPNGLVLITGPTGSGKSTTLAALI